MRILVTGHNGYIGSVLVPALWAAGHDVLGLDTFSFEDSAFRRDLRDVEASDLSDFDAVIHLAALTHDPLGDIAAERIHEINYEAAVRLARIARDAGVGRFFLASSSSVYGGAGADPLTENAPLRPTTAYGISKAREEEEIARLADRDFSPSFLRIATAYGVSTRLRADTLLNNLVCWAHATGRIRITGDPQAWRPMVHVQDIAAAFAATLGATRDALHGQALNVGANGENYQLCELAEIVRRAVPGCSIDQADREPDTASCRLDFSKLSRTLPDFRPQWNAVFGAKDLYAALQEAAVTRHDLQGRKYVDLRSTEGAAGLRARGRDAASRWPS